MISYEIYREPKSSVYEKFNRLKEKYILYLDLYNDFCISAENVSIVCCIFFMFYLFPSDSCAYLSLYFVAKHTQSVHVRTNQCQMPSGIDIFDRKLSDYI